MVTDGKDHKLNGPDRKVNTKIKVGKDGQNRLPHERDESPDCNNPRTSGSTAPLRGVIRQAQSDLERGLVDTDLHGERGVEKVTQASETSTNSSGKAAPKKRS